MPLLACGLSIHSLNFHLLSQSLVVITGTCAWNSLTTAFTLRQETVLFTQESKSCQGCCKLLGYNYVSSSKQQHRGTCGHALIIEVLRMLNVQCIELCSSASGTAASLLFTASARAFAVTETTQTNSGHGCKHELPLNAGSIS